MTIYELKPAFQGKLRPTAALLADRGWTANRLTAAGFAASALTGGAFALGVADLRWLYLAPLLLFARMAFNALDGLVAREHDQATPRGRVFNELGDFAGDAVAYLPAILLLRGHALLVAIVVVLGLATEFVAILDANGRRNDGPFGKSDRAVAFGLLAVLLASGIDPGTWTAVALLAMAAAAGRTVSNRLRGQP